MPGKSADSKHQGRFRASGWRVAAAAVLVLATVAVYRNSLDAPFVFDDGPAVERNASIRHVWPLTDALRPPMEAAGATGRPLVNLSLALNYAAGGLDVRGYHAINIALHVLAALTLWGVLRRTLRSPVVLPPVLRDVATAESVAFCTAWLWAVHPLLTESVVCVVQRNEIMGGLFVLLTLYAFIRSAVPGRENTPLQKLPRRAWMTVAVTCCLLGMASKEIVATAPLLVLLYDRTFVAGGFREAWQRRRVFYLALAGTWLLLAWLMVASHHRAGTVGLGLGVSSWHYLLTQCRALAIYVKLAFWPDPLVVDYGMNLVQSPGEVWPQGLLVLTLLGATVWALWRRPVPGFVGAWFFVILAPSSSFVPLITQTIAEHRMYLPLIAVVVLVVATMHHFAGRRSGIAFACLIMGAGWLTIQRNEVYRDEHRLWTDVITRQPQNARGHVNLAHYFSRQNDWAAAIRHNTEALRLLPDYADAHNGLGQAYQRTGRLAEALVEFSRAFELKPEDPLISFNHGSALAEAGRLPEAVARFEDSLRVQPAQGDVHNNLGLVLLQLGRPEDALACFQAGLRADPDHAGLRGNYANVLAASGRPEEAAVEYERFLRGHPDAAAVRQNYALTLMRLGRAAAAIPQFEQALAQLAGSAPLHHNFALALAQVGRVSEAIAHEQEALRINPGFTAAREHLARLRTR